MPHTLAELKTAITFSIEQGDMESVFDLCCIALKHPKADSKIAIFLSNTAVTKKLLGFNPIIKNAITRCFKMDEVDHQKLALLWEDLLLSEPDISALISEMQNISSTLTKEQWDNYQAALNDDFFLYGLKKLIVTAPQIEAFLTTLRRTIVLNLLPQNLLKTKDLPLLCALATQNFNNEYAFRIIPEELHAVTTLSKNDPVDVAMRAAYEPLTSWFNNFKLSAVKSFRDLTCLQVAEPRKEEEIKIHIPHLGVIENDVSSKVRAQYEDNPYPRWLSIDSPSGRKGAGKGNALIAGCGTGRFLIQMAVSFPGLNLTAIDITRSSLAYAARMSEKYQAHNINFFHCDILNAALLNQKFDFINCSGVLHHMADPLEGWRQLISVLAPGGGMFISLYSTKARKVVFEAREFAQNKNYSMDASGLRKFRQDIIDLPNGHPLKGMSAFKDFYSLSEVRDLIFHVQEKTYDILELKQIFDRLDLDFVFMKAPHPKLRKDFLNRQARDPDRPAIDIWDEMERELPAMFGEMYNFLCLRRGETQNFTTRLLYESGILGS